MDTAPFSTAMVYPLSSAGIVIDYDEIPLLMTGTPSRYSQSSRKYVENIALCFSILCLVAIVWVLFVGYFQRIR